MKTKGTYVMLIVMLFLIACGKSSKRKTNNGQKNNLIPQPVETQPASPFEPQTYRIPNELKYVKQHFDFIYTKFRPIGWSASGKLAYITEPADEACGCYFFSFFIQDMESDELLYKYVYNDQGAGESLSSVWDKQAETFKRELTKHKIVQKEALQLKNRSFTVNKQPFELSLQAETKTDPDFMIDLVQNTHVFLKKGEKQKKIWDKQTDTTDALLNVSLPGVLVSPFDEQIAVVVQQERRGYEGSPHVLSFRLVGANLKKEF